MKIKERPDINREEGDVVKGDPRSSLYKFGFFTAAFVLLGVIAILPSPDPLVKGGEMIPLAWNAKATLALLAAAIVLWITEVIPFSITALIIMLLIPVFGIDSFKHVIILGFGNQIIAFFIGVLILSSAFTRSGMGNRLSGLILSVMGTKTRMVILGFIIVGTLLSMWVTDMAVAAILMPLGVAILRQSGVKPLESNFGKGLMISCAWGPLFGGIATPSGCGPNPLTIGFLKGLAHIDIDFITWMSMGLPASLLMIPAGWLVITRIFPPEIERVPLGKEEIRKRLDDLGPLGIKEKWTLSIFLITISAWIAAPFIKDMTGGMVDMPMQAVALSGALFLFLPGIEVLSWKEAQEDVDWGGIILICAGISLGMVVYNTGAARWLSWLLLGPVVQLPATIRVFVIVLGVSLLHLAFSSNTVTGTIIIPLLIALATDLNINPWLICAPAAFTSSLAFILVTETPTNVIPYSAGYFAIKDMAKAGIVMTLVAALCVGISILVFGNLWGNY
ncbi:MAG: DASS family sodium-coupled anion symporter [Deltaproteobacteria bacterium]|nr:DASS family sodium-coupled anion symporter [Deltaproteobacteria bacterium]MBN2845340.1 DASS family sodium-coupled anion symporter [Deltaproteobacteria bacterium]